MILNSAARGAGRTVREDHAQLEEAAFPQRLLLAWNTAFPRLQIEDALRVALRLRIEAKRVISSPLLALFVEPVHTQRHG